MPNGFRTNYKVLVVHGAPTRWLTHLGMLVLSVFGFRVLSGTNRVMVVPTNAYLLVAKQPGLHMSLSIGAPVGVGVVGVGLGVVCRIASFSVASVMAIIGTKARDPCKNLCWGPL